MFGNRPSHYDKSAMPDTPYQKAADAWDKRIGSARSSARNWRMFAFAAIAVAGVALVGVIALSMKSHVETYVVRVDKTGAPTAVHLAGNRYQPTKAEVAYFLGHWVRNVRGKPADAVVMKKRWLAAYDFLSTNAANKLNAYAAKTKPLANIGEETRTVHINHVIQKSQQSYQVAWTEKTYKNSALTETHRYTGLFTITIRTPTTQQMVYSNPLGIYITDLSWSANS